MTNEEKEILEDGRRRARQAIVDALDTLRTLADELNTAGEAIEKVDFMLTVKYPESRDQILEGVEWLAHKVLQGIHRAEYDLGQAFDLAQRVRQSRKK